MKLLGDILREKVPNDVRDRALSKAAINDDDRKALDDAGADTPRRIETGTSEAYWHCSGCRRAVEKDMLADVSASPDWLFGGARWRCSGCIERPYFEAREDPDGNRLTRRMIRELLGDDTSHLARHRYWDRAPTKARDRG